MTQVGNAAWMFFICKKLSCVVNVPEACSSQLSLDKSLLASYRFTEWMCWKDEPKYSVIYYTILYWLISNRFHTFYRCNSCLCMCQMCQMCIVVTADRGWQMHHVSGSLSVHISQSPGILYEMPSNSTCWRLHVVPSILWLGSLRNAFYSKI